MIAERGVELDAGAQQGLVRLLELPHEILRTVAAVHVVADHEDELERESRVPGGQLLGHVTLMLVAGAGIADDRELHRLGLRRQRQVLGSGRDHQSDTEQREQYAAHGRPLTTESRSG